MTLQDRSCDLEAGFHLLLIVGRPRSQALEGRELVALDRRFQGGFQQGDLGDAGARQHLIVRCLELGQRGLGDAKADVGGGVAGQNGDDLVTLDVLAVLDAQLDHCRAAQGTAGNDHCSGRRFGIAARDQGAGRADAFLGAAGLPLGGNPQASRDGSHKREAACAAPWELARFSLRNPLHLGLIFYPNLMLRNAST